MAIVAINPIFGYGWMRSSRVEPVPDPFTMEVVRREERGDFPAAIVGKVIEEGHPYLNYWALLLWRAASPEGPYFNVFVYDDEPPFAREGAWDPEAMQPLVTGFAGVKSGLKSGVR